MRNQEQNGKYFCRRIPLSKNEIQAKSSFRKCIFYHCQNKCYRDDDKDSSDNIMIKIKIVIIILITTTTIKTA